MTVLPFKNTHSPILNTHSPCAGNKGKSANELVFTYILCEYLWFLK